MADTESSQTPDTAATANTTEAAASGEEFKPYSARKGWVEDALGRFHEVDDQQAFLQAYPGSKAVKSSDVVKNKVGHAEPKQDESKS